LIWELSAQSNKLVYEVLGSFVSLESL